MRWIRHPLFIGGLVSLLLAAGTAFWRARRLPDALQGFLDKLESKTLDLRFELRGSQPVGDEIAILAFDDKTMAADADLFARRDGWARVFSALDAAGPKVVGVDAFFSEPESLLNPKLQDDLNAYYRAAPDETGPAHALLARVHHETLADVRLAAAIAKAGNLVLALHLGMGREDPVLGDPALSKGKVGQSMAGGHPPPEASWVLASLPAFNAAAKALGVTTAQQDDSGVLRELIMARAYGRGVFVPMAVQLVALFRDLDKGRLAYLGVGAKAELRIGSQRLELEPGATMLLNWRGPAEHFPTYSVVDLVGGKLDSALLRDRIVLLGITYFGHDRTSTSLSDSFPGVEVHATAVDNLLRGDPLRRPTWLWDCLLVFILGLLVSLIFHPAWNLAPAWRLLAVALLTGGVLVGLQMVFASHQIWMAMIPAISTALFVSLVGLAAAYLTEGLARRRLRHAFAHYLAGDVIDDLVQNPKALKLGGERRELTVLFSDIRGFTSVSEGLEPGALSDLLNEYLTPMTQVVLAHRGMLDKYMGDAVMAVFGAPVPYEDHPAEACRTALVMLEELAKLQTAWRARGMTALEIGIGVNTGLMSVGNMGSAERFDYTVLGDQVNLGSRLEGLNKTYGTRIIVSEITRQAVGDAFAFRELDFVAVKGKQEPVRIYELLHVGASDPEGDAWVCRFEQALQAYRGRHWSEAHRLFTELVTERADAPAAVYVERCKGFVEQAPPENWDGVYRMLSK
ncbi:MAG: adenylate/guanylate cyclase domain-containing protein [Deltaproteobacteria bacterium]|nr:adenylate/guanylate cyclase domain-containing protein [Deltaproteobacteria bacterium]